jgi:hypothetical protein
MRMYCLGPCRSKNRLVPSTEPPCGQATAGGDGGTKLTPRQLIRAARRFEASRYVPGRPPLHQFDVSMNLAQIGSGMAKMSTTAGFHHAARGVSRWHFEQLQPRPVGLEPDRIVTPHGLEIGEQGSEPQSFSMPPLDHLVGAGRAANGRSEPG